MEKKEAAVRFHETRKDARHFSVLTTSLFDKPILYFIINISAKDLSRSIKNMIDHL